MLVYCLTQGFARFEMRYTLFGYGHTFAAARIASNTRRAVIDRKAAKTPNFNALPMHQRVIHRLKNGFHRQFGIALSQMGKPGGQFFGKV